MGILPLTAAPDDSSHQSDTHPKPAIEDQKPTIGVSRLACSFKQPSQGGHLGEGREAVGHICKLDVLRISPSNRSSLTDRPEAAVENDRREAPRGAPISRRCVAVGERFGNWREKRRHGADGCGT